MISFFCPGTPRPAGSKRAFPVRKGGVLTGRSIVVDSSGQKGKDWRSDLRAAAMAEYKGEPLRGPLKLTIQFRFLRPNCHYGTGKNETILKKDAPIWHTSKPDITKLVRAVEDALTGILWVDDAQIVLYESQLKRYDEYGSGCAIHVDQL